jgi:hypothetical protein
MTGSHNDINVLQWSPVFSRLWKVKRQSATMRSTTTNTQRGTTLEWYLSSMVHICEDNLHPWKWKTNCFRESMKVVGRMWSGYLVSSKLVGLLFVPLQEYESWTQCGRVITACVIWHNIIVEDEHERANQLQGWEFQGPLITPEHVPQEFEAYLWTHRDIQHRATHDQLQLDLVEHLWN